MNKIIFLFQNRFVATCTVTFGLLVFIAVSLWMLLYKMCDDPYGVVATTTQARTGQAITVTVMYVTVACIRGISQLRPVSGSQFYGYITPLHEVTALCGPRSLLVPRDMLPLSCILFWTYAIQACHIWMQITL